MSRIKDILSWGAILLLALTIISFFIFGILVNQPDSKFPSPASVEEQIKSLRSDLIDQKEVIDNEIDVASFKLSQKLLPVCQKAIDDSAEVKNDMHDLVIEMRTRIVELQGIVLKLVKDRARK